MNMKMNLLLAFLCFLTTSTYSSEGGGVSGGGDGYVAQFTRIGHDVLKLLQRRPLTGVDTQKFKEALSTVRVVSKKKLKLKGQEVDGINTPKRKLIKISRSRWDELQNDPKKKFVFVAHEYFSVMGLDDLRYALSYQLFDDPGVPLYEYTCRLIPELESVGADIILKVTAFKDFSTVYVQGQKDEIIDFPVFYSLGMSKYGPGDLDFDYLTNVSIGLGFTTLMVTFPYSELTKDPRFDSEIYSTHGQMLISADPLKVEAVDITCNLKKYE